MDVIDFAIVRSMFTAGESRFFGSRAVVDPRITAREIAPRVHLSEVAVRARIARLRERGVLLRDEVWPNPRTLGIQIEGCEFPVPEELRADDVFRDLGTIDGVFSARLIRSNDRRRVWVNYVRDGRSATAARRRRVERLLGARPVRPPTVAWLPDPPRPLTLVEWRIVSALREHPKEGLGTLADRVGLSAKTFARYYRWLIDAPAIFWMRVFDTAHFPAIVLHVYLEEPTAREAVKGRIERAVRHWLPFARGGLGERPDLPLPWLAGIFWAETAPAAEELMEKLLHLPGVRRIVRRLPGRIETYPAWFDQRLAELGRDPSRSARAIGLPFSDVRPNRVVPVV